MENKNNNNNGNSNGNSNGNGNITINKSWFLGIIATLIFSIVGGWISLQVRIATIEANYAKDKEYTRKTMESIERSTTKINNDLKKINRDIVQLKINIARDERCNKCR